MQPKPQPIVTPQDAYQSAADRAAEVRKRSGRAANFLFGGRKRAADSGATQGGAAAVLGGAGALPSGGGGLAGPGDLGGLRLGGF